MIQGARQEIFITIFHSSIVKLSVNLKVHPRVLVKLKFLQNVQNETSCFAVYIWIATVLIWVVTCDTKNKTKYLSLSIIYFCSTILIFFFVHPNLTTHLEGSSTLKRHIISCNRVSKSNRLCMHTHGLSSTSLRNSLLQILTGLICWQF